MKDIYLLLNDIPFENVYVFVLRSEFNAEVIKAVATIGRPHIRTRIFYPKIMYLSLIKLFSNMREYKGISHDNEMRKRPIYYQIPFCVRADVMTTD